MHAWLGARSAVLLLPLVAGSLVGCGDQPAAPPVDLGRRDLSDGGSDMPMGDGPIVDMTVDGGVTGCTADVAGVVDLLETAYVPGGRVPYGAEANVDGLFVAASIQLDDYPFHEVAGALLSEGGTTSGPVTLHASPGIGSSAVSVTRSSGTGFLALWDASGTGGAKDLYTRPVSASGVPAGAMPSPLTATTMNGETNGSVVRTTSAFAASWVSSSPAGTVTAVLDAMGSSGTPRSATGTAGTTLALRPFTIAGVPRLAFYGNDSRIRSAAIGADGTVAGTSVANSLDEATTVFEVAGDPSGAGLVYEATTATSRTEVRFRAINSDGSSTVTDRTLSAMSTDGKSPSIAPIAGGYLVLFRQAATVIAPTATLRLLLVGTFGDTIDAVDLLDPAPAAFGFHVRTSPDGEAYVVFQEPRTVTTPGGDLAGAVVRAFRIVCE